jgi:hypothetical protein
MGEFVPRKYEGLTFVKPRILQVDTESEYIFLEADMLYVPAANCGEIKNPIKYGPDGTYRDPFKFRITSGLIVANANYSLTYQAHPLEIAKALGCEDWYWSLGGLYVHIDSKCAAWSDAKGWISVGNNNQ